MSRFDERGVKEVKTGLDWTGLVVDSAASLRSDSVSQLPSGGGLSLQLEGEQQVCRADP
jgi:hypothetical protein